MAARQPAAAAPAATTLLLLLFLAAAGSVDAIKCGRNAGGKRCANPKECCSNYGFCGTGTRFCGAGRCASGPCLGAPKPRPKPKAPAGCVGTCGVTVADGRVAKALCRRGLVITAVPTAVYGAISVRCVAPQSLSVVKRLCLRKGSCAVPASQLQFGGDPCRGVKKSLWFRYTCGTATVVPPKPDGMKVVSSPEGGTATASCPTNQVIAGIKEAFFGRLSARCNATTSHSVVVRACLGQRSCTVPALSSRFGGDPCRGVLKFLAWRYSCAASAVKPPVVKPPVVKPPVVTPPMDDQYSELWGKAGEMWRPSGRIADHSYAGYMANERRIPAYPERINVRTYGAVPNDNKDDTAAFQAAIKAASALAAAFSSAPDRGFQNEGREGVAILVPAGTYQITQALEVLQSNVVLRGEGSGRTTLYFPKPLSAIYGSRTEWATGGTFITIDGWNPSFRSDRSRITPITAAARRGETRLQVGSTAAIQVGSWIRIFALERYRGPSRRRQLLQNATDTAVHLAGGASSGGKAPLPLTPTLRDAVAEARWQREIELAEEPGRGVTAAAAAGSLDAYLYGEMDGAPSGKNMYEKADHIRFVSRVKAKGADWIELERPLNYDLRLHWEPHIFEYAPTVQHSGLEGFTVQFAHGLYPDHHVALGYNGIGVTDSGNCWVRDVKVVNPDNGFLVHRSDFVTATDIEVSVDKPRYTPRTTPYNGHHAIWAAGTVNTLITRFSVANRYWHDVTFAIFAENTVFSNGGGLDLNLDFHRGGPHNNLASNINLGLGSRPFKSGGATSRGAYAAANNTWWNVYPANRRALALPPCTYGPLLTWVGLYGAPDGAGWKDDNSDRRKLLQREELSGDASNNSNSSNSRTGNSTPSLVTDGPGFISNRPPLAAPAWVAVGANVAGQAQAAASRRFPGWCAGARWWVENTEAGRGMQPSDLHAAMVAKRLRR